METTQPNSTPNNEPSAPVALEEARPVKKRAGFWSRTGMVLVWLLLIVLVLGFGSGLLTQLPVFRHFVVNQFEGTLENGTNGRLTVGEIKGNLLQGFVMDDVTLLLKTGTAYDTVPLIHADKIIAQYSLLYFLRTGEIKISGFTLQNPTIHVVRFAGDTSWNYELFAKAPAAKTPSKPFSQIIDLASLQIQNGSFYLRDYNFPSYQQDSAIEHKDDIDWNDVQVQGIDLETRFNLHGTTSQTVHVSHLQFREKNSGLFVQRLGFSGYLDSNQARIDNAKIVTGHSDLGFSIKVSPPKIIETGLLTSMKNSLAEANVSGPVISTNELKQFLPKPLGFLGGSPGIDLVTTGEFGKLHIKKLALDFRDRGTIVITGNLNNLHQADSLTMDLELRAKNLSNATLNNYVPGLHLPDLSRFGSITISDLTFIGAPQNFHTKFDAKSSGGGDAAGDVAMDLRKKEIVYRADLKSNHFNIAAIAHDPNLESSISAETHISGLGTNWKIMNANVTLRTDAPSTWGKYHVTSLGLAGSMNRGTLTVSHLDGGIDDGSQIHIRNAMAELISPSIPFRFAGSIKNFPLANILNNDAQNPARVDIDANLSGTAKDFDEVTGTAHLRLFDLACEGHALPEDTADITIAAVTPKETKLSLQSSIADVNIDGRFQTGDLLRAVPDHLSALLAAIGNRDFPDLKDNSTSVKTCIDSLDLDYHIQIKDLRGLADFVPQTFILGQGALSGSVKGCENGNLSFSVNGDSVAFIVRDRPSIDSVVAIAVDTTTKKPSVLHRDTTTLTLPKFGSGTPRIHLMPTTFRLALNNLSDDPHTALRNLDAKLDFATDSIIRLGSALLYNPKIGLRYKDKVLDYIVRTNYNNALGINVNGNARFPNGDIDLALDTFKLIYKNPYFTPTSGSLREFSWINDKQARIQLARNGILTVDTFHIIHSLNNGADPGNVDAQRMSFGGILHGDTIHAWANFPSFELENLKKILPFNPNSGAFDFSKYTGKVRDLQLSLGGTLEQPDISAKLFADTITYKGEEDNTIKFDSNYLDLTYQDQILRGILDLHVANINANAPNVIDPSKSKGGELRASLDSIPMVIAFEHGPNYSADSTRAAQRPLSASIHAEQFPLDIATPFLPTFRQILGTGNINFTVTGTREHIEYAGNASIQNGELLLASTNMWYLFGGPLVFAHNALTLQNDSIHNISADDSLGAASINGTFTFNGFDVTNFNLRLRSDHIMVLSDAAKESLPVAYGPVTINTGGQDFQFYNTFDEPKIKGTINIMSADVTMPPSDNGTQPATSQDVIYETIPRDTLPIAPPTKVSTDEVRQRYAGQVASIQMSEIDDTIFPNWMKNIYRNDDGSMATSNPYANTEVKTQPNALGPSFTDKLRMDLLINTAVSAKNIAQITMPFGVAYGILGSQLTADLKSSGTLKIERGDDLETHANGGFELSPNSVFTYIQNFNISKGTISFTNNFGNPGLDIEAEYVAQRHGTQNSSDQAKIVLDVKGTKDHPVISTRNYIQQTTGGEFVLKTERTPGDAQEDAIYFLGTGYFKSDIAGSAATSAMLQTLGGSVVGNLAGNLMANIFGSTSSQFAIRSASLNFGNAPGAQLTAAFRDITVKLGGTNNPTGLGYNLITDFPLSDISSLEALHNLLLEMQYNNNPSNSTTSTLTQQPIFLAKFLYIFNF